MAAWLGVFQPAYDPPSRTKRLLCVSNSVSKSTGGWPEVWKHVPQWLQPWPPSFCQGMLTFAVVVYEADRDIKLAQCANEAVCQSTVNRVNARSTAVSRIWTFDLYSNLILIEPMSYVCKLCSCKSGFMEREICRL